MLTGLKTFIFALFAAVLPANLSAQTEYQPVEGHFIAAIADPTATSGNGAQNWGYWNKDPGPRGVWLRAFPLIQVAGGYAPAGWVFDENDWWLDENGLLMEKPEFPLQAGKYLVTGDRPTIAQLTIHPADENGDMAWELSDDAQLYDVTHLPCRASNFTPAEAGVACTPTNAIQPAFPIATGTPMPPVQGCLKQDYAVMFVLGISP